jgi:hypothetical protein
MPSSLLHPHSIEAVSLWSVHDRRNDEATVLRRRICGLRLWQGVK